MDDLSNASREQLTSIGNKDRELENEYFAEQQTFVKIPFASRQKITSR